jgi:DNA-binding IscR family transcriptional regulator
MNASAMAPPAVGEFLFGDPALHGRFAMAIELLARVMTARPHFLTTAELADALSQPPRAVRSLLVGLHRSGLLLKDGKTRDAWSCPSTPGTVTLADVFRSVSDAGADSVRKARANTNGRTEPEAQEPRSSAQQGVDLLLMQATMAINQVVFQHLQSFDLGRLQAVGQARTVQSFHARTLRPHSDVI